MARNLQWVFGVVLCFGLASGSAAMKNILLSNKGLKDVGTPHPQANGICSSIVEKNGYECQELTVTTEDGYILSIQRIPKGRTNTSGSKPAVLLQHGVLMDGVTWLLNSPDQSLAYILADSGFDVWIANSRGTKYSRGHTSLGPDDSAYWDWTWDELASYDLPSFVQFVYDQTGQRLNYVGHSLGTLIALATLSQNKLLNMLQSAALMSPIAYLGQVTSPLTEAAAKTYFAEAYYKMGNVEFNPKGNGLGDLLKALCKKENINCYDLMTSFTGPNCCLNSSTIDFFLEHEPQSTATKNMIHLSQMMKVEQTFSARNMHGIANRRVVRNGTITMYDYGDDDDNKKHYGQPTPPVYDMSKIPNDFPIFISYGGQDALSDVKDVDLLLEILKSHDSNKLTAHYRNDYAHADFVMGINANQVVYEPMIAFFRLQS